MATRTRIILFNKKEAMLYRGSAAVSILIRLGGPEKITSADFPGNWAQMSKRQKLTYFARQLPVGFIVKFYQEPKGTRTSKSAYRQEFNKLRQENGF